MPEQQQAQPDFTAENHGTVCIFWMNTDACREWVEENVSDYTPWGENGIVVEPRYLYPLVEGMLAGGLVSDQFEVAA
jgi:hypothetical protein